MANILVIDDDSDVRQILRVMLKRGGHDVTLAPGGVTGLEYANQQTFDLIISDVMMPDMDGYQVARRLRASPKHRQQMIMILTARAQPADYQAAMAAGADAYLSKPVTHDVLNTKVSELLRVKEMRDKALSEPLNGTATAGQDSTTAAATSTPPPTPSAVNTKPTPVAPPPPIPAPAAVQTNSLPKPTAGNCRYIAVFSLQGGTGSSTIAVNLASALVRLKRRVCLLELSASIGQAGQHLRLAPSPNWLDLPLEPDSKQVGKTLLKHPSGLFVLAAPGKPIRQPMPVQTFRQVLTPFGGFFNDVVIDLPHTVDALVLDVLQMAQLVLVVAKPDALGIFAAQQTLSALQELGVPAVRVKLLLNQIDAQHNGQNVASQFPSPIDVTVPFDSSQSNALATGQPLVLGQPNSPLASALGRFAAALPNTVNAAQ